MPEDAFWSLTSNWSWLGSWMAVRARPARSWSTWAPLVRIRTAFLAHWHLRRGGLRCKSPLERVHRLICSPGERRSCILAPSEALLTSIPPSVCHALAHPVELPGRKFRLGPRRISPEPLHRLGAIRQQLLQEFAALARWLTPKLRHRMPLFCCQWHIRLRPITPCPCRFSPPRCAVCASPSNRCECC